MDLSLSTEREKCYDPGDRTFTFVDGEDDLDFECNDYKSLFCILKKVHFSVMCNDYKSLRAKMSCGHAVTPTSLTNWCRRQLDEGECRFKCGQICDGVWEFDEVCKMALLTPEETKEFENKMFSNSKVFLKVKLCPGCKCHVVRTDLNDLSVQCTVCTDDKKRTYMFCWQCLREWKGPAPRSDCCANDDCKGLLGILKSCPDITFENVEGVTGCPSIRACPTCGSLVEHDRTLCKNIVCDRCKVEFCFVCLKLTADCLRLKQGSHYECCSSGVAGRQTSIPVWQRT